MQRGELVEKVIEGIGRAAEMYSRLVLVVGSPGSGKTRILEEIGERLGLRRVNVGLELAKGLLEVEARMRPLRVGPVLEEILGGEGEVVLLDDLEILFDASLMQDPLLLLEKLSRNRTVVAAWSGILDNGDLVYAMSEHPEYRRYPVLGDVLVVSIEE